MTNEEILDLRFESRDIGDTTVRDYFKELLFTLFREGEGFSGKRPFGNSGWEYDIAEPLVKAGVVKGSMYEPDEEGEAPELDSFDQEDFDRRIGELIASL